MSLSENLLQSQIAHNAYVISCYEAEIARVKKRCFDEITHYKYYSGLHVDKCVVMAMRKDYDIIVVSYRSKIAKYAKLQKALKAELKEVREYEKRVKIVGEFINSYTEELLKAKLAADNKDNFATDEEVKAVWEKWNVR